MPELASVVSSTLAAYYEEVREKVHALVAPISTEQLWRKPYPYGNSIGHLLLHLTGNLNHYIGARIAGTGYVRNRPLEFSDTSKRSKEQVLADFDRAIDMVAATIRTQSAEDLAAPYSDPTEPRSNTHFAVFLRMAAHAYHHTGQIIYLSKEVIRPAH
ncbi:MAG TPA: DinB family protein [Candidatus Acidoferrales bacterium]|nr:DinB family protein [Candidatus Acidoferrales bacterium]